MLKESEKLIISVSDGSKHFKGILLTSTGSVLFVAGALPALMGMVWSAQYSSSDSHVAAPLVVGFVILIVFALWETFGKLKHPLTPPHMFASSRGRDFTAPAIALGVINMF